MDSPVTIEELRSFHSIDRELYSRLVIKLRRDISTSMQVIALWMWLEDVGYPNIIHKMLSLPDSLVKALADEALICLNCITSDSSPPPPTNNCIPCTLGLMKQDISLQFFHDNRLSAIRGITKKLNNVCLRTFADIVAANVG
uniref:Uncharacterized protein n=1 Tax=Nelumbo nucifera TaxID=4432 RepID=A0A822YAZ4_NELNU|nr:TPA_asm: hypothetical protein HUJ06_030761 [Nelumbo nucifera]